MANLVILESAQRELEEIAQLHKNLVGPHSARNITDLILDTLSHVEMFPLDEDTYVIDTPGFSSFDTEELDLELKARLPETFPARLWTGCSATAVSMTGTATCWTAKIPSPPVQTAGKAVISYPARHAAYRPNRRYAAFRHSVHQAARGFSPGQTSAIIR